ncbi:MAG TPA: 2-amino-4-hydroxy-6-hydroxymethyldihydropteridine diphosphokinase [Candidatus Polarisedimenticolia bacterium]|nr:2-amino-4-hydroxy-6-hydroxymethyldihydropteridine diphosphokinase [Candidatus Polarisedimenticolia bacterium]
MPNPPDERVFIGAGARDGPREANLVEAVRLIAGAGLRIRQVSSMFETQPVGLAGDRTLLNTAFEIESAQPPEELLEILLRTEARLGRRRLPPAVSRAEGPDPGPRPIDLDLLFCGRTVRRSPELTLPHPRLHLRRFVLAPLAEIAPEFVHPVLNVTIAALLAGCADPAWVRPHLPASEWWPAQHAR